MTSKHVADHMEALIGEIKKRQTAEALREEVEYTERLVKARNALNGIVLIEMPESPDLTVCLKKQIKALSKVAETLNCENKSLVHSIEYMETVLRAKKTALDKENNRLRVEFARLKKAANFLGKLW